MMWVSGVVKDEMDNLVGVSGWMKSATSKCSARNQTVLSGNHAMLAALEEKEKVGHEDVGIGSPPHSPFFLARVTNKPKKAVKTQEQGRRSWRNDGEGMAERE
jgi:hypothetical protein